MLKNYLLVALRNLRRDKMHSVINITGLAIGMAVVALIGLWVWDEYTFDRYNPRYDHIARLMQNETSNGETGTTGSLPYPLVNELRTTYASSFKRVVASWWTRDHVLDLNNKKLAQRGTFMEPGAAELLALQMIRGTRTALDHEPGSILLSATAAQAIFGDADPLGQILHLDSKLTVAVRGVYADLPTNSAFKGINFIAPFELFANSESWVKEERTHWGFDMVQIFVELADNVDVRSLSARLKNSTLIHMGDNPLAAAYHPEVFVQPMSRWHLYSEFKDGVNTGGAIQFVWLFGTIGLIVLLLACINFMNLSTARSERRAREVGIRKAIGSLRGQLIAQFYIESMTVSLVAFFLSLGLVSLALPWFNTLADKTIAIAWSSPWLWLSGLAFSLVYGGPGGQLPGIVSFLLPAGGCTQRSFQGRSVGGCAPPCAGGPAIRRKRAADHRDDRRLPADTVCAEPSDGLSSGSATGYAHDRAGVQRPGGGVKTSAATNPDGHAGCRFFESDDTDLGELYRL